MMTLLDYTITGRTGSSHCGPQKNSNSNSKNTKKNTIKN